MKSLITSFCVFCTLIVNAQIQPEYQVGVSLFGFRQFSELPTRYGIGRFFVGGRNYTAIPKGLVLKRTSGKSSALLAISYYRQKEYLDDSKCNDCLGGEGILNALEIKTGFQKDYRYRSVVISPGLSAYYLSSKVKGHYGGGFTGKEVWDVNSSFHHLGLNPSLSFAYRFIKPLTISLESGAYFGKIFSKDATRWNNHESFYSPIQSVNIYWRFE